MRVEVRKRTAQQPRAPTRDERGMALPFTIFLVAVITMLLASAFSRTAAEHEIATSGDGALKAMLIARSGLQTHLAADLGQRPVTGDSVRYNMVGGYAWVASQLIQNPADTLSDFTYFVRSIGYYIEPAQGMEPQAKRTVGQFARWKQSLGRPAAFVAANVNEHPFNNGAEFVVDGNDACSAGALAGVRTQAASDVLPGAITGSPPQINFGTPMQLARAIGISWEEIENGEWTPDYTDLSTADGDTTYSTYLIDGFQETINDISGTGLLIVLNRVDTEGFEWDGIVITGKDFDVKEDTTIIRGMLITGMDILVGDPDYPSTTFDANTRLEVHYNSCNVARAFRSWRGFAVIENSWVDSWAEY